MIVVQQYHMSLCRAAAATWPGADWLYWHKYNDNRQCKYATTDASRVTPACTRLLQELATLNCPDGTFPDLCLHGAGMHWMPEGSFLTRHQDGQVHPIAGWYRKWNAILFLSDCEGGELLVDDNLPVQPALGRLVMFDSQIPHEVTPVTKGDRKSLSLFWWALEGSGETTRAQFY